MKKLLPILLLCLALCGCTPPAEEPPEVTQPPVVKRYALVVKDTSNPYMQHMYEGFTRACEEIGATAVLGGSDRSDSDSQIQAVQDLIDAKVDAIAVAANDSESLSGVLQRAMESGIEVLSVDSGVHPKDRMVHIQQASPERIGRVLIQAASEMIGGSGKVAILSTTETMPNQALWVEWMLKELEQHPEKYAGIELVEIAYGLDEHQPSAEAMAALLDRYPDLNIVICPTTVGFRAAAEVVAASGRQVFLTGLGLPSEIGEYIRSGLCPWMYLWNPIDVGYTAAYAADALAGGSITGGAGETVSVGRFGKKAIQTSSDGGTEIVVGNPYQFDKTNIAIWDEMF